MENTNEFDYDNKTQSPIIKEHLNYDSKKLISSTEPSWTDVPGFTEEDGNEDEDEDEVATMQAEWGDENEDEEQQGSEGSAFHEGPTQSFDINKSLNKEQHGSEGSAFHEGPTQSFDVNKSLKTIAPPEPSAAPQEAVSQHTEPANGNRHKINNSNNINSQQSQQSETLSEVIESANGNQSLTMSMDESSQVLVSPSKTKAEDTNESSFDTEKRGEHGGISSPQRGLTLSHDSTIASPSTNSTLPHSANMVSSHSKTPSRDSVITKAIPQSILKQPKRGSEGYSSEKQPKGLPRRYKTRFDDGIVVPNGDDGSQTEGDRAKTKSKHLKLKKQVSGPSMLEHLSVENNKFLSRATGELVDTDDSESEEESLAVAPKNVNLTPPTDDSEEDLREEDQAMSSPNELKEKKSFSTEYGTVTAKKRNSGRVQKKEKSESVSNQKEDDDPFAQYHNQILLESMQRKDEIIADLKKDVEMLRRDLASQQKMNIRNKNILSSLKTLHDDQLKSYREEIENLKAKSRYSAPGDFVCISCSSQRDLLDLSKNPIKPSPVTPGEFGTKKVLAKTPQEQVKTGDENTPKIKDSLKAGSEIQVIPTKKLREGPLESDESLKLKSSEEDNDSHDPVHQKDSLSEFHETQEYEFEGVMDSRGTVSSPSSLSSAGSESLGTDKRELKGTYSKVLTEYGFVECVKIMKKCSGHHFNRETWAPIWVLLHSHQAQKRSECWDYRAISKIPNPPPNLTRPDYVFATPEALLISIGDLVENQHYFLSAEAAFKFLLEEILRIDPSCLSSRDILKARNMIQQDDVNGLRSRRNKKKKEIESEFQSRPKEVKVSLTATSKTFSNKSDAKVKPKLVQRKAADQFNSRSKYQSSECSRVKATEEASVSSGGDETSVRSEDKRLNHSTSLLTNYAIKECSYFIETFSGRYEDFMRHLFNPCWQVLKEQSDDKNQCWDYIKSSRISDNISQDLLIQDYVWASPKAHGIEPSNMTRGQHFFLSERELIQRVFEEIQSVKPKFIAGDVWAKVKPVLDEEVHDRRRGRGRRKSLNNTVKRKFESLSEDKVDESVPMKSKQRKKTKATNKTSAPDEDFVDMRLSLSDEDVGEDGHYIQEDISKYLTPYAIQESKYYLKCCSSIPAEFKKTLWTPVWKILKMQSKRKGECWDYISSSFLNNELLPHYLYAAPRVNAHSAHSLEEGVDFFLTEEDVIKFVCDEVVRVKPNVIPKSTVAFIQELGKGKLSRSRGRSSSRNRMKRASPALDQKRQQIPEVEHEYSQRTISGATSLLNLTKGRTGLDDEDDIETAPETLRTSNIRLRQESSSKSIDGDRLVPQDKGQLATIVGLKRLMNFRSGQTAAKQVIRKPQLLIQAAARVSTAPTLHLSQETPMKSRPLSRIPSAGGALSGYRFLISGGNENLVDDIAQMGGKVLLSINDVHQYLRARGDPQRCLFLSNAQNRKKIKYLYAASAGLPLIHLKWIDEIKARLDGNMNDVDVMSHELLDIFRIPRGLSFEKGRYILPKLNCSKTQTDVFEGKKFLVDKQLQNGNDWLKVLEIAGAKCEIYAGDHTPDDSTVDAILVDPLTLTSSKKKSSDLLRYARVMNIPILNLSWATECIVQQKNVEVKERYTVPHYVQPSTPSFTFKVSTKGKKVRYEVGDCVMVEVRSEIVYGKIKELKAEESVVLNVLERNGNDLYEGGSNMSSLTLRQADFKNSTHVILLSSREYEAIESSYGKVEDVFVHRKN